MQEHGLPNLIASASYREKTDSQPSNLLSSHTNNQSTFTEFLNQIPSIIFSSSDEEKAREDQEKKAEKYALLTFVSLCTLAIVVSLSIIGICYCKRKVHERRQQE